MGCQTREHHAITTEEFVSVRAIDGLDEAFSVSTEFMAPLVRKWTPERHASGSHDCWLQRDPITSSNVT
jgi:hypothetical protein